MSVLTWVIITIKQHNSKCMHGAYISIVGAIPGAACPPSFPDGPATLAAVAPGGSYVWPAQAPGAYYITCQVGLSVAAPAGGYLHSDRWLSTCIHDPSSKQVSHDVLVCIAAQAGP